MGAERARGQPLLVLAVILSGWIGVRALAWNLLPDSPEAALVRTLSGDGEAQAPAVPAEAVQAFVPAPAPTGRSSAARPPAWQPPELRERFMAPPLAPRGPAPAPPPPGGPPRGLRRGVVPPPLAPLSAPLVAPAPAPVPLAAAAAPARPPGEAERWIMVAGGHQLLALAATAMLPMPADIAGHFAAPPAAPTVRRTTLPRWSGDAWLFLRDGAPAPITFPRLAGGGSYGASQACPGPRYPLAPSQPPPPQGYLRRGGPP